MITANEIMAELHVDETDEETNVFESLISQASALIRGSISFDNLTDDFLMSVDGDVYSRLIITLVTSLYYDRELSKGYSKGVQIMLSQFRNRVLMEVDNGVHSPKI